LNAAGKNNNDLTPVQRVFFQNAVTGRDQLRQRVAFALTELWVVSDLGVNYACAFPPYWRVARDHAFGNYRDLIKAMTLNPAMGHYLNMANNNKGNPAKGTSANENYGRELMQLFTLGLTKLNLDGSPVIGTDGHPVPTYTPSVVTDMSRALTGWTYPTAPGATEQSNNPIYYFGQMVPHNNNHDTGQKTIVGGIVLPAGQTAEQDLDAVIDALMQQSTMAPFVSKQLIQHLVTSNPSPAYVQRVASVFLDNGSGERGDLQAVIIAILQDPEARGGDDPNAPANSSFGHLREPVLFMASMLRALNATLGNGSTIYNQASSLGQQLFYEPSVFSYFSPQYRTTGGLPGPEFQIYSTQTASTRADIVNSAIYQTLDKVTKVDLTPFANQGTTTAILDYINQLMLHWSMSAGLQSAAAKAANAVTTPLAKAQAALYVVLTSAEYQVIH
jgi:uncharacterized protein (DUF1800 family)